MAALGMTSAAVGAAALTGCTTSTTTAVTSPTVAQTDVLNFALNLEYLEATFYAYITTGTDIALSAGVTGGSGAISGGPSAALTYTRNSQQIVDLLNEIYFDELNHVNDLRSILGELAVARPAINLAAAGTITASNALSIARQFEDVGVTAYAGAAALLSSSNLGYAAQILAVEGFHAGALRLVSIQNPAFAAYANAGDTLDVKPFDPGSATAAANGPTAAGAFFATAGTTNATTATPAGFAFTRTTSQILAILYASTAGTPAASGTAKGGFFAP